MVFGNYKYLIYIVAAAIIVLILHLLYTAWKIKLVRNLSGNGSSMMIKGSPAAGAVKAGIISFALILSAFIMLRPQWGEKVREVHNEGSDLLIALDVSRSMLAKDVEPSRLDRGKDSVRWIAESLKGDRIGLILFAGDAFLQCPLTSDIGAFMMFLDSAGPDSINTQGTDIGRVLYEAEKVFKEKRVTSKILVLITDGEDHEGSSIGAAERFKELGVSVYTLGIGGEQGGLIPVDKNDKSGEIYYRDGAGKPVRSRKNPELLKKLAGSTGGAYIDITDSFSGLKFILEIIQDQQSNDYGSRIIKEKTDRFDIFAVLLIILLSVELLLPERGISNLSRESKKGEAE